MKEFDFSFLIFRFYLSKFKKALLNQIRITLIFHELSFRRILIFHFQI